MGLGLDAPACETATRWSLIVTSPRRMETAGFSPTVKRIVPSPCPCAGEPILIHSAALVALQVHSRFVAIVIEPCTPDAGTDDGLAVALNVHRVSEGAATLSDEELHATA